MSATLPLLLSRVAPPGARSSHVTHALTTAIAAVAEDAVVGEVSVEGEVSVGEVAEAAVRAVVRPGHQGRVPVASSPTLPRPSGTG